MASTSVRLLPNLAEVTRQEARRLEMSMADFVRMVVYMRRLRIEREKP